MVPGNNMRKVRRLKRKFYDRDPREVSRDLLGKLLVRNESNQVISGRIVEVEAYLSDDPAAHSAAGRTARNDVLFGPPGRAYVYFIYGNHWCFNVSCLPDGIAGGVLFRAIEPVDGIELMARARGITVNGDRDLRLLTSGREDWPRHFGLLGTGTMVKIYLRLIPIFGLETTDRVHLRSPPRCASESPRQPRCRFGT